MVTLQLLKSSVNTEVHVGWVIFAVFLCEYFLWGQTNVSRNRGGQRLELKDISCENG